MDFLVLLINTNECRENILIWKLFTYFDFLSTYSYSNILQFWKCIECNNFSYVFIVTLMRKCISRDFKGTAISLVLLGFLNEYQKERFLKNWSWNNNGQILITFLFKLLKFKLKMFFKIKFHIKTYILEDPFHFVLMDLKNLIIEKWRAFEIHL